MRLFQKRRIKKHSPKAYFFGFSRWKHRYIRLFFHEYPSENLFFVNPFFSTPLEQALKKGLDAGAHIYFWGRKHFPDVEAFAAQCGIKIFRVEDGFIRSVGLGSDLTQPYSQVIDRRGIYFDPTCESDLEHNLNFYDFEQDSVLLERAKQIQTEIIKYKISKYNTVAGKSLSLPKDKITAVVIGQVEDDASIKYGADGMSNLDLLKQVKSAYPERYLLFKPHPDVLSGNRVGHVDEKEALKYCDEIVSDISVSDVLEAVDEVHTMTSLVGLEGLLYGKKVYTYGMPFYAGWGLTIDMQSCKRRKRQISIEALIAATYLLYPRYISPQTEEPCSAERVIQELKEQKDALHASRIQRGKMKIYTFFSRYAQKLLSLAG